MRKSKVSMYEIVIGLSPFNRFFTKVERSLKIVKCVRIDEKKRSSHLQDEWAYNLYKLNESAAWICPAIKITSTRVHLVFRIYFTSFFFLNITGTGNCIRQKNLVSFYIQMSYFFAPGRLCRSINNVSVSRLGKRDKFFVDLNSSLINPDIFPRFTMCVGEDHIDDNRSG